MYKLVFVLIIDLKKNVFSSLRIYIALAFEVSRPMARLKGSCLGWWGDSGSLCELVTEAGNGYYNS